MSDARMGEQHDWCGMALYAVREAPAAEPWTVRTFAVVQEADLRGDPVRAQRTLLRSLAEMSAPVDEPLPTWTSDGLTLLRGTLLPRTGDGAGRPGPVLIGGAAANTDVPTQLLGFTAVKPVTGLVVVVRGYVTGAAMAAPGGPAVSAGVWRPGGNRWPAELDAGEGQPAVAAFAVDRRSGAAAMLAHRVPGPGQQLPAGANEQFIDLATGGQLGFLTLTDNPWVALAAACGKHPELPAEVLSSLPRAPWLVGRWMLHEAREAAQGRRADPGVDVALPGPPLGQTVTWAAVRADQLGRRRLGALLSAAQARLLPDLLLAEECIARSPAQRWLWRSLEELLDGVDGGSAILAGLRAAWARHPEVHEPERFFGAAASTFR